MLITQLAHAEALDPFQFGTFVSQHYDTNLFRLPDDEQPGGDTGNHRAVFSETTGLTVRVDQTYGLQHIALDGSVTRTFYHSYGDLDYTANDVGLRYDWTLTPSFSGDVIIKHSNLPTDFAYSGYATSANPTKSDLRRFDVDWLPGAALHPRLSTFQVDSRTSQALFQQQNSRSTSLEAALVYEFRSTNSVELYGRRAKGSTDGQFDQNLVDLTDPEFTEREYGIRVTSGITDMTKLKASFGYLQQTHPTFKARDFDGFVGSLSYRYDLTAKTRLELSGGRSLGGSQTFFSSYLIDDSIGASAVYQATEKTSVTAGAAYDRRRYLGAVVAVATELRQNTRSLSVGANWAALRALDLSMAFTVSNRSSNDHTFQYDDKSLFVTGALKF